MNKIKELRKEKNITVAELAKELGTMKMETEHREMNLYGKNYHRYSA